MNTRDEFTKMAKLKRALLNTGLIYLYFFYGAIMVMLVCGAAKTFWGMPRPVFFEICKPDTGLTCKDSEYVSKFTCTSGYNWWRREDASRSFPSSQAAMGFYAGLFMVWYLQRRAVKSFNASLLAVPAIQIFCVSYAVMCGVGFITDHTHHWWDVVSGAVIGFFTVFFTCNVLMNNFK